MVGFGPSRLVRTGETLRFSGRLASYWPYQNSAEQPYTDYLNNTPKFVVSMALVDQIFGFPSSWGSATPSANSSLTRTRPSTCSGWAESAEATARRHRYQYYVRTDQEPVYRQLRHC
jgi:hypothetical protein